MASPAEHQKRLKKMVADATDIENTVPRFKGIIYGHKGAGKTVFAVELAHKIVENFCPDTPDIVYVDTSEGYVSLRNHPHLNRNIKVVRFRNLEYLGTLLLAIKGKVAPFDKVGAIILDEMSTMAYRDLEEYTTKRDASALAPEWPDYNQSAYRAKVLVNKVYEVPGLHLIMVAHEKDKKNKQGDVVNTHSNFNPQFGEAIGQDAHLIGRLHTKVKAVDNKPVYTRELQVHPTALYEAKTRVGGLPVKVTPEHFIKAAIKWLRNPEPVTEEVKASDSEEIDLSVDEDEIVKIESS